MSKGPDPASGPVGGNVGFFSWVVPGLKNRRTLKTWVRCTVVVAVTLILMVDNMTLNTMGQAGFFAAIVSVMLPPYLPLSLFTFAAFTLLFGMLLGWAWGATAMAASLSVRSASLLVQQQQHAQASIVQGIPISVQQQRFVFQGMFLDPRSSAVYGAFFFIGTFALGALRAYIPKLTLLSIFGSIVLDIMCSYGPSFPTSQYTLAKQFLIPSSYYVAVAIASLIFIFPESLNHAWLTALRNGFLNPTFELLNIQSEALKSRPSDRKAWAELNAKGNGYRQALAAGTEGLLGQIGMIDLEFSVGRLGPGDLKKISGELKSLMFRAVGIHSFQTFVNDVNLMDEKEEQELEQELKAGNATPGGDRHTTLRRKIKQREIQHGHDLDSLVPILAESSAALRATSEAALKVIIEWFQAANSSRWAGFFQKLDKTKVEERNAVLVKSLNELQTTLEHFRKVDRVQLVKPFERFFDPATGRILESVIKEKDTEMFAARSLFICFVFVDTIDTFADRLARVLRFLVTLDAKRPKPRLWTPSGFGKLGRKIMSRRGVFDKTASIPLGTSNDPTAFTPTPTRTESVDTDEDDSDDEDEVVTEIPRRNPDALPPTTAFGKAFLKFGSCLRFLKSPEGIFALRHAIVSVALWIPSVCKSSAWFYYENRGLWALIMAQTGLAVYAGDQIAGFVIRILGIIIGLLLGMAAWYIGAGRGDGNPYGIVVATTVIVAPFLFARLASPPQQMMIWVMAGVTVVFIVGYGWINTHQPVVVSSGVGVELGWKRALLIIIGFTAAFIVMLFPRPNSSRTLVRRTLGANIAALGTIFAGEVEAFLAEEVRARSGFYEKVEFVGETGDPNKVSPKEKRVRQIVKRFLSASGRLQSIVPSLTTATFEPQVQGTWPHEQYELLHRTQSKLLSALVILIGAFAKLDTSWCSILVHRTPFLNPNLLSDIFSHLSILSSALSGAHPLPPALPRLRDRVVYHEHHSARGRMTIPINKISLEKDIRLDSDSDVVAEDNAGVSGRLEFAAGRVDGSSIGFEDLSLDILMDEQLPAHSTAVVVLSNVVSLIDDMTEIVRRLCGETTFLGYDALQRDYLGREEKALGDGYAAKMK
ncbi:hypothetical protein BDQ12DRAFT_712685 [Crucibulum laeve]|uniref:ER transporter 6TM N-terminal domain-containing protein n=1 Tax=Crucibulum laeve TaxID=68775 RepID=A0A5C3MC71_9AGAR|nr:hypothetical protein BDQ12DRAFT_712685 [Crucibulum laeve]